MTDHKHYVPILRWKRAEWIALRLLRDSDRRVMTPLLELVPGSFGPNSRNQIPPAESVLTKIATEIGKDCGALPVFVDMWLLSPMPRLASGIHPMVYLATEAGFRRLTLIPVTGLGRDATYQTAVAAITQSDRLGVCLRIHPPELTFNLAGRLDGLLDLLGVQKAEVDICVDYQNRIPSPGELVRLESAIPALNAWRTFTVASGAFPRDLQGFSIGQHLLPRADWRVWLGHVGARRCAVRLPSYADYAIQCGQFAEPPERANFSASIRYTAFFKRLGVGSNTSRSNRFSATGFSTIQIISATTAACGL